MTARWWQSRGFVLGALTLGGAIGLPFLWYSPFFSRRTKIILTVATVVLAVLLFWFAQALYELLQTQLESLAQVQSGA